MNPGDCFKKCRYYVPDGKPQQGQCHRYPPSVLLSSVEQTRGSWPIVLDDNVCGEFKGPILPPRQRMSMGRP